MADTSRKEKEIQLVQTPVIKHALFEIGERVSNRIAELNLENLIATDDTLKSLKNLRAELNKEFADYEAQRKSLKESVAKPFMEFESVYKAEVSSRYEKAINTLKDKIDLVETRVRDEKKARIESYFNELCIVEKIDFLTFEKTGIEIILSTSDKQYRDRCNQFVQRVSDDILLIQAQDYPAEIMTEYKKSLNASNAITTVVNRKKEEKLEEERIRLQETQKRQVLLRNLSFHFDTMTGAYHHFKDENLFISKTDVENLSVPDWNGAYVLLEQKANILNKQQVAPQPEEMKPPTKVEAPAEPLQAPLLEKPSEPIFTAFFEVKGTKLQINALAKYMKDNGLTYKNFRP